MADKKITELDATTSLETTDLFTVVTGTSGSYDNKKITKEDLTTAIGAGTSGTSGNSGTSGTSGNSGTSGTSGTSGAAGSSGTSGTDGTDGTNFGTSGTSGTSGTDGTDASGTSGTSGNSGTSGTSGTSGLGSDDLDASPDIDHSVSGPSTNDILAGDSVSIGELVYLDSDGKWYRTDADLGATSEGLLGIVIDVESDGETVTVALPGSFVRDDSWSWTVGAVLYVDTAESSGVAGGITETQPTGSDIIRIIGWAVSSNTIYFNPGAGRISMSTEEVMTYASAVEVESSGAALGDGAYATTDTMMTSANHFDYPLADVMLYVPGFASALSGWKEIWLYRRDMNLVGGSNDEPAPSATYLGKRVGEFKLPEDNASDLSGYYSCEVPLSQNCYFYIANKTGQELNSGWTLTVQPKTRSDEAI